MPPHVRPAERQRHRRIRARSSHRLEAVVAIVLLHALETNKVPHRTLVLAVVRADVAGHRMAGSPQERSSGSANEFWPSFRPST